MDEEKSKQVCKNCRWRVNKYDKDKKQVVKWCVEADCPIYRLDKCPL